MRNTNEHISLYFIIISYRLQLLNKNKNKRKILNYININAILIRKRDFDFFFLFFRLLLLVHLFFFLLAIYINKYDIELNYILKCMRIIFIRGFFLFIFQTNKIDFIFFLNLNSREL